MMITRMPAALRRIACHAMGPMRLCRSFALFCVAIPLMLERCHPSAAIPHHRRVCSKIAIDPRHNQLGETVDLLRAQRPSPRNMVPFLNTSAAATCGGVLSCEYRMTAPGCLFPVFRRLGGTDPLGEHLMRVPVNEFTSFAPRIFSIMRA